MLLAHGVPAVFGLAGGQTLPLYDAIRSRAPRIRHVAVRDERNGAYAADGYARLSGRVGVCDATVGPGAIKLTSGLAEAFNSSIPLVAIVYVVHAPASDTLTPQVVPTHIRPRSSTSTARTRSLGSPPAEAVVTRHAPAS